MSIVALILLLVRITVPVWLALALIQVVDGNYLTGILIVGAWAVAHFIIMTLNARDTEWIRQGEQMRLEAMRRAREQDRDHYDDL